MTIFFDVALDTLPQCKILKQSDHYLWRYYILKIWGDTSAVSECSLGVNLVIWQLFYVASSTSPLYKIWPLVMEILHLEDLGDMSVVWRARDFILVSNHKFLIPMNHLELLIYSFILLDCFKIQYYCQIWEIFTFWFPYS